MSICLLSTKINSITDIYNSPMNATTINNLLRVLESREADGIATVTGEEKSKVIAKLAEKLTEVTEDEVPQVHNYCIRALDLSDSTGEKIVNGVDRLGLIASHVGILSRSWGNKDTHMSAILDMLQRRENYTTQALTVTGESRTALKSVLSDLIDEL